MPSGDASDDSAWQRDGAAGEVELHCQWHSTGAQDAIDLSLPVPVTETAMVVLLYHFVCVLPLRLALYRRTREPASEGLVRETSRKVAALPLLWQLPVLLLCKCEWNDQPEPPTAAA